LTNPRILLNSRALRNPTLHPIPDASVFTLLLILLLLCAIVLIPVVLLQAGKGGGLAAMGGGAGTDTLFGSRQATTILTKATWWAGGIFIALAFVLSLLSSRPARRESILRQGLQNAPAAPAAGNPAGTRPATGAQAPATPLAPAAAVRLAVPPTFDTTASAYASMRV
jgi:preprotein translocase subunit SecG